MNLDLIAEWCPPYRPAGIILLVHGTLRTFAGWSPRTPSMPDDAVCFRSVVPKRHVPAPRMKTSSFE